MTATATVTVTVTVMADPNKTIARGGGKRKSLLDSALMQGIRRWRLTLVEQHWGGRVGKWGSRSRVFFVGLVFLQKNAMAPYLSLFPGGLLRFLGFSKPLQRVYLPRGGGGPLAPPPPHREAPRRRHSSTRPIRCSACTCVHGPDCKPEEITELPSQLPGCCRIVMPCVAVPNVT